MVAKRKISTSEGVVTGLLMLGQITGILAGATLAGWLFDRLAGTTPLGLAIGVLGGSVWATVAVLMKVKKEVEINAEDAVDEPASTKLEEEEREN